jgi:hypothetical protein
MENCRYVWLVAAVLSAGVLAAEEPEFKTGPGIMRLSSLATVNVPAGYSYTELPVILEELKRKAIADRKPAVATLGIVRDETGKPIQFTYLYDPAAGLSQTIWRVQAFLHINTLADRMAESIQQRGTVSARVLEQDRYDPGTGTLRNLIGLTPGFAAGIAPASRYRTTASFARHGAIFVEFEALADDFAAVEAQCNALLQSLSYSPRESPGWSAWLSVAALGRWFGALWAYALTGLLIGISLALFSNYRELRGRPVQALDRSVTRSA